MEDDSLGKFSGFQKKMGRLLKPYYLLKYFLGFAFHRFVKVLEKAKEKIIYFKEKGFKELLEKIKNILQKVLGKIKYGADILIKLRWRGRMILLLLIAMSAFVIKYFDKLLTGSFLPHMSAQSVTSFEERADRIFLIDKERGTESFDSSLRHTEYIVLMKKTVANILPTSTSGPNPMGLFEIFLEGSNQEVAVEVKDREAELIDRFQRVIEETPFDSLGTTEGKMELKRKLKTQFNQILNKGRIKEIYFKLMSLKSGNDP